MYWDKVEPDSMRRAFGFQVIQLVPFLGWKKSLMQASKAAYGDSMQWTLAFPGGTRDVIWYISSVSDRSMKSAFLSVPAVNMSSVIDERFRQNRELKHFVRQVMFFDMWHPVQGISRMQRTAGIMFECISSGQEKHSTAKLLSLNILYTLVVIVWLLDRTHDDLVTKKVTRVFMRFMGEF
jgi:hypothetical protein